jgi:lipopolysaccharide transport system permease protein
MMVESNTSAAAAPTVTILEPGRHESAYWRDLWRFRELFYFLAWRDILVRYKQTAFGVAWALLQPLLTMAVFTIVFGRIAKLPSDGGAPYPILVFAALLSWQFFAGAVTNGASSLVSNANLVSKVYFPRLIVPSASVIPGLVDFTISLGFLAALMAWFGAWPDWRVVTLPLFLLLGAATALGAAYWLSALTVKYRDFRYVVPFVLQAGLFISPVGFSSTIVPESLRTLYSINPLVGVIDGFRWALLGGATPLNPVGLTISVVLAVLLLASGIRYFRATEKTFADVI